MALPPPTIRQLIEAIQAGIMDLNQAQVLVTSPELFAKNLNKWQFVSAIDPRIGKFKEMTPEGFELANEKYELAKQADSVAAVALANDCAKMMCAASRIVPWKAPAGAIGDSYLDQIAQP